MKKQAVIVIKPPAAQPRILAPGIRLADSFKNQFYKV